MRKTPRVILILKWGPPFVNPVIQLTQTQTRLLTNAFSVFLSWMLALNNHFRQQARRQTAAQRKPNWTKTSPLLYGYIYDCSMTVRILLMKTLIFSYHTFCYVTWWGSQTVILTQGCLLRLYGWHGCKQFARWKDIFIHPIREELVTCESVRRTIFLIPRHFLLPLLITVVQTIDVNPVLRKERRLIDQLRNRLPRE